MTAGFLTAILINLPFYHHIHDKDWFWTENLLMGLASASLAYMAVFFHELGHTLFAWFYGYVTLPMFDFSHGGGVAYALTGQSYFLMFACIGGIGYLIYLLHEFRGLQVMLGLLAVLILATGFSDPWHDSVIRFAGPAAEPLFAAFFLTRAFLDLAPRGDGERFLNAVFGFGFLFQSLIEAFALLDGGVFRDVYYAQKGGHGVGDFDMIARNFPALGFDGAVKLWIALCFLCLIVPFCLYLYDRMTAYYSD